MDNYIEVGFDCKYNASNETFFIHNEAYIYSDSFPKYISTLMTRVSKFTRNLYPVSLLSVFYIDMKVV